MGFVDKVTESLDGMSDDGGSDRTEASNGTDAGTVVRASARCMYSEDLFVIRFEEDGGMWTAMSTSVPDTTDADEAGSDDASRISGPFDFPPRYDGCPHCSNTGLFHCADCDGLACWDGETNPVVCPWCHSEITLEGEIDSLEATKRSDPDDGPTSGAGGNDGQTQQSSNNYLRER